MYHIWGHRYNILAQEIRDWLVAYIYQWDNFPAVGDHAQDYLHKKRTQLVAWCEFVKQSGNRADELTLYLLSRICNLHIAVICKEYYILFVHDANLSQ